MIFFVFMLTHGFITFLNFNLLYKIDKIEHFIAGILVAFVIYAFLKKYAPQMIYGWIEKLFIVFATVAIGVFWEFFEFSYDALINIPNNFPVNQLGNTDTMGDLLCDTIGAIVFILILFILKPKSKLA